MVAGIGAHQVRGHRDLAGAQRPDMHVVDGGDTGLIGQEAPHVGLIDVAWHRVHGGGETLAQQPERSDRDHGANQHGRGGVQPRPAQPPHAGAGQHRRQRYTGVGEQVQIGAAAVEVAVAAFAQQPCAAEIDRDAQRCHQHHRQRRNFRRGAETAEGFPSQGAGESHQQQGIGQRRQQRRASPAVGVAVGRLAFGDDRRAPCHCQPQHVAQVVQGVRQ